MSNSINHKIQKYNYKLKHATNSKEKSLYQAKLNEYKNQLKGGKSMRGGEGKEEKTVMEQITGYFTGLSESIKGNFDVNDKQIAELDAQFKEFIERIKEQCCKPEKECPPGEKCPPPEDCTEKVKEQIAKMQASYEEILKLIEKSTKETGENVTGRTKTESEKLTEFSEMMKQFKMPCPESEKKPSQEVAKEAKEVAGEEVPPPPPRDEEPVAAPAVKHEPVITPSLHVSGEGTKAALEKKKVQEGVRPPKGTEQPEPTEPQKGGKRGTRRLKY
jgi:hypothetical protein